MFRDNRRTIKQNGAIPLNHPVTTTKQIWRVRLVHAELGARVVEASCEEGGQLLAMAFGEADTTEVAEDRARRRATEMLLGTPPTPAPPFSAEADQSGAPDEQSPPPSPSPPPVDEPGSPADMGEPDGVAGQPAISPTPTPAPPSPQHSSPSQGVSEPADWSDDLALVEVQLDRLGWDRDQESVYLERCFGHMERSSITRYQDLRLYIDALQMLSPTADPCMAPLPDPLQPPLPPRELLMETSNTVLRQLGWTTQQGRAFLERHFGRTSRQSLSDEQLMRFNQQLDALLATGGGGGSPAS